MSYFHKSVEQKDKNRSVEKEKLRPFTYAHHLSF